MKTTLEIDDALYREAKALAALTGRKMKDLVNEGLESVVRRGAAGMSASPHTPMKLPLLPSSPGKGRVTSARIAELETSSELDRW